MQKLVLIVVTVFEVCNNYDSDLDDIGPHLKLVGRWQYCLLE